MDDVEVLRALVEEYSPSGNEQQAVRRFSDLATELGFDVRTDEVGSAIARIGRGSPGSCSWATSTRSKESCRSASRATGSMGEGRATRREPSHQRSWRR